MNNPNFRLLVRNLRKREEAAKRGCCPECGRKLPKKKSDIPNEKK